LYNISWSLTVYNGVNWFGGEYNRQDPAITEADAKIKILNNPEVSETKSRNWSKTMGLDRDSNAKSSREY